MVHLLISDEIESNGKTLHIASVIEGMTHQSSEIVINMEADLYMGFFEVILERLPG